MEVMMENNELFKCPICKGIGFYKGDICICIKGLGDDKDDLSAIKDLFGDLFSKPTKEK
jgi:hypothetical protein